MCTAHHQKNEMYMTARLLAMRALDAASTGCLVCLHARGEEFCKKQLEATKRQGQDLLSELAAMQQAQQSDCSCTKHQQPDQR